MGEIKGDQKKFHSKNNSKKNIKKDEDFTISIN